MARVFLAGLMASAKALRQAVSGQFQLQERYLWVRKEIGKGS